MAKAILTPLVQAGVLARTQGRLRVSPRFAAHADEAAARLRAQGRWTGPAAALEVALGTWDDYLHDVRQGALAVWDFMADHHQAGAMQPTFPLLDAFAAA